MTHSAFSSRTRLLQAGRPESGWVNTPVSRASTYVFESVAQWREVRERRNTERLPSYGARGTDSTFALEDALIELEGGYRAKAYCTGQAAITIVLLAYLRAGDHVLITDAVYEPVRRFCKDQLSRLGIEYSYFKADGSDVAEQIRANTRLIYAESPGSLTYEMVDLPAMSQLAKKHDCLLAVDNTWGSGVLCNPLQLGADISICAATKYISGHADVMMGTVVTNERAWQPLEQATVNFGQTVGADDAYLVLRGIRSLPIRLAAHGQACLKVANWLEQRHEVARVYCPALPSNASHALWQRDCTGQNGLLTVEFDASIQPDAVDNLIDKLRLFGLGSSWGGFESLVVPVNITAARSVSDWADNGPMIRLHIGLEDVDDLILDLELAMQSALE